MYTWHRLHLKTEGSSGAACSRSRRCVFPWCLCALIFVLLSPTLKSQTENRTQLPADSQHLVTRLKEYEIREKNKLEYQLNKKRKEVLVILKQHLKKCVKNRQLDQALAIKKEISRIQDQLPKPPPTTLVSSRQQFELNGKILKASAVPAYFEIDIDENKGRIFLDFEHPRLAFVLENAKRVTLVITTSNVKYAGSVDSVLVTQGHSIVGQHDKPEVNEKLHIRLNTKKLTIRGRKLSLEITNSGKDRIGFQTDTKQPFATLVLEN